jgi:hypothetical protein
MKYAYSVRITGNDTGREAHPASWGSFPGGKAAPPSSTEIKNGGAVPPLSHTSSWSGALLKTGTSVPF